MTSNLDNTDDILKLDNLDDLNDIDNNLDNLNDIDNNINNNVNDMLIDSHQVFSDYKLEYIDCVICLSDNPKTGLFLKENLHLIDSLYLSRNNSKWVVDFILDPLIINYIEIEKFYSYNNDKIVNYLINNYSDKLSNSAFCSNNNDIAVDYILNNILINYESNNNIDDNDNNNRIINDANFDWYSFSYNNNDKAVDFLLQNPDKIYWFSFSINNNNKAVDFLINNPNENVWSNDLYNTNDKFVDYILENYNKLNWYHMFSATLLQNENTYINPKIIDFFFRNRDKI